MVFRSLAVDRKRRLNLAGGWPAPDFETFLAFELGPGESIPKRILFVPSEATADFVFSARSYDVTLWMWSSRRDRWEKGDALTFTVDRDDLATLSGSSFEGEQGGGQFAKLRTRDKPLDAVEKRVGELQDRLKSLHQR